MSMNCTQARMEDEAKIVSPVLGEDSTDDKENGLENVKEVDKSDSFEFQENAENERDAEALSKTGDKYDLNKNAPQDDEDSRADCSEDNTSKTLTLLNSADEKNDSFDIATKDDVDAGSVFSLFMEKDFRYYFQHPYFRLFTAYFVTFCNFLIYAEDPVAHSRTECNIPVIGNCFSFVFKKYFPNAWNLLKVSSWLTGTFVGLLMGKLVFHTIIFNKAFRLKMFHDDKGSWMTMFLSTILFVFIFSYIYNAFLLIGGDYTAPYHISTYLGLSNDVFMKAAATGTWCGDFFTAWMVTDMMLQEKLYPSWAKPLRKWWNTGIRRIILFWLIVGTSSFIVIFVIATDYINWDSLNRDFLHTNEMSRAFLASFILVLDITIVMQDWDFPHFIGSFDIKLPGVNTGHIRFKIPKLFKKLEHWHIHISGKWFNYGILFMVILLDLNMWKNQIFYSPYEYGQYIDVYGRIYTVEDHFSLNYANQSILTFEYRNSTINNASGSLYILGDTMMNARYHGYPLSLKGLAFVPSLLIFLIFGIMIFIFGRRPRPTRENPYGGRLRKRRRNKFSARKKWNSVKLWFMRGRPVLTAHQKRSQKEPEVIYYGRPQEVGCGEIRPSLNEQKEREDMLIEEKQ